MATLRWIAASARRRGSNSLVGGLAIVLASISVAPVLSPAWAQGAPGMAGYGESETSTLRATVTALDLKGRTITLAGPQGETVTLSFGDQLANIDKVKPGDVVTVRYYDSVAYVLSPPGTKMPENALAAAAAQTPPGGLPAGVVATRLTVTGLVVGVNQAAKTLSIVDPSGGRVRTVDVKDPQGQKLLGSIKVGDTVTAYISDALLIAIDPA